MSTEPFPPPAPSDAAIRGVLAQRVDACGLSPGMVVGITEEGRRRIVAHGAADSTGRPIDGDTVFEVGSITKLFTALLLAGMVHRGEAALDEPVAALLPPGTRVPERNGKPITLLHLVNHTSGLPRIPSDLPASSPEP